MKQVLDFLRDLNENNNRDWFNENKERYLFAKESFDRLVASLIMRIGEFDPPVQSATVRECVFRIYRDVRFSHNKLPYKKQFSAFIAWPGGWKSKRSGYYIHIEPENSFFSAGIYRPEIDVLRALRRSFLENIDEFNEVRHRESFRETFGESFYDRDKLKRMPVGFPADFEDPELLKLKHYLVEHPLDETIVAGSELLDYVTEIAEEAYPFNEFLNFTVDEMSDNFDF